MIWDDERAGSLVDHDVPTAGSAWLGLEAAKLARDETRQAVAEVLEKYPEERALDLSDRPAGERLPASLRGLDA